MKKILVLINSKSRSGEEAYSSVIERLEAEGYSTIALSPDERSEDPNSLIRKYLDQLEFTIVGGGDGSVNYALPALIETNLPLVVYPLGTANNLARSMAINAGADALIELIKNGKPTKIDVGTVNSIPFVNVAGLGVSTTVNKSVSPWLKKKFGVLAFFWTAFISIPRLRPFRAHIKRSDGSTCVSRSWQITVCNGKFYGAGMAIKEDASLKDKYLHCLSTEITRWSQLFTLVPAMFVGKYEDHHEINLLQDTEFELVTRRRFPIDVDGDIKTHTPAKFGVLPRALTLIVPPNTEL